MLQDLPISTAVVSESISGVPVGPKAPKVFKMF